MIKNLIASAAILASGTLGMHAIKADAQEPTQSELPSWMKTPCEQEDSVNCFWDAGDSGNGKGHSFIVRKVPGKTGMICVFYIQKKFAQKHDYCS